MRRAKEGALQAIYNILSIHLGSPPDEFDWQWTDKDGQFHRDGKMTPMQFAEMYVTTPMDDYVCLVHDPTPDQSFGKDLHGPVLGQYGEWLTCEVSEREH